MAKIPEYTSLLLSRMSQQAFKKSTVDHGYSASGYCRLSAIEGDLSGPGSISAHVI